MRILIVEDDPNLRGQVTAALKALLSAVDNCADGEEADFLTATSEYDAVVLDLGLPRVDGLSLLKRWRAAGVATPILILTARGTWHERVEGLDSGADDYM